MSDLRIDGDRLWLTLHELAAVGAFQDEHSGLTGVNRLALTDADAEGRRLVKSWFEAAGLDVRVDRIGNVIGRRAGREDVAPVMAGSHIDSVPTGGAFDGALGVLAALEVVRTIEGAGVVTRRPLEIAFFTDEEGARFGTDMLGSATASGRISVEQAWSLRDERGVSVKSELERIGFLGEENERLSPPHAYVELHIEQGPILEEAGMDLGVVTGVQAISWQELTISGKAAHAGTTPMRLRKDAGLAVARINAKLHEMTASGEYGDEMRATMGRVDLLPNRVNIVPRQAVCTVDLRNPDDAAMARSERALADFLRELEAELGVTIVAKQTARTPRVRFDEGVQALLARRMDRAGMRWQHILSGAGHDAQELSALCPTAMIFVPGKYEGISHNPREYSTPEACARGAQILLEALVDLASS